MSGTVWEPGRQMGTQEGATGAPSDLADATHEPNQRYDREELQAGAGQSSDMVARVRQSLDAVRAGGDRAGVDRLIADVEALLALVDTTGSADRSESAATAPADLEE